MSESRASFASRTPAELAEIAFERIRIVPASAAVQVRDGDRVIARSTAALELHETGHDVRLYFPRSDVDLEALRPLDRSSHCPFKGDASDYWALERDESGEPVAWSYPDPIPASEPIRGYIAFYDAVAIETVPAGAGAEAGAGAGAEAGAGARAAEAGA